MTFQSIIKMCSNDLSPYDKPTSKQCVWKKNKSFNRSFYDTFLTYVNFHMAKPVSAHAVEKIIIVNYRNVMLCYSSIAVFVAKIIFV